ncbi:lipoprotein, partial [Williamsoniiplasma lucivorax]
MKKLLTLLGSIGMVAATAATVVACNKNKEPDKKPHLNTIIKKTDLGLINDRTPELIRAAIKAQNDQSVTDVIAKKLVITPNTNAEVMDAKVTSPDFSESVNVTYSIDPNSRIQNLNALKAKIGEANKLITSELEDNNPQAVQDLRDAIKIADAVDKESQAKAAQGVLEIAINAFNKAITQLETANLNALKAKIDEANKLITSELEDNNP